MKTTVFFLIGLVLLVSFAGNRADAALIPDTDPAFPGGANNVTRDTVTGLGWLDLTSSGGISYDDITLQFATGGTYDGWRHATGAEVNTLLTSSAGLPLSNQPIVDPLATGFIGLVGTTQVDGVTGTVAARGRYNDDASGINNLAGSAFVAYRTGSMFFPAFTEASILDNQPVINSVIPTSGTGHWLVRDTSQSSTVPEPSTLALATLGLIGLAWFGWRKRR